ncbi:hypothetical protein [Nonomuraea turcica]|uniref:hypothetical protein n=1 Tax=Nonomuraea sp. G32 TaxID=3067274 RepID=UPI00273B2973|nr:hypothetical protein [Nonomuraea sp. G32]MDP4511855.1 hypothetical protein [Nonomuraea sp. G32]
MAKPLSGGIHQHLDHVARLNLHVRDQAALSVRARHPYVIRRSISAVAASDSCCI